MITRLLFRITGREGDNPVARISSELRGQLANKWEGLIKELC